MARGFTRNTERDVTVSLENKTQKFKISTFERFLIRALLRVALYPPKYMLVPINVTLFGRRVMADIISKDEVILG